jgi:hypothetical protein
MSQWIRLDVGLSEHPKFIGIPILGRYLFIEVLCMIKKMGTKGVLSSAFNDATYWATKLGEPINHVKQWWNVLIDRGIIVNTDDGGITVHNWAKYQEDPTSSDRVSRFRGKERAKRDVTLQGVTDRYETIVTAETLTGQDSTGQYNTDPPLPPSGVVRRRARTATPPEGFSEFWQAYPRKTGRGAAEKSWERAKGRPPLADVLAAIERQRHCDQWTRDNGQYIPLPSTWLNQARWDDVPIDPSTIETPDQRRAREREEAHAAWLAEPEKPGRRA